MICHLYSFSLVVWSSQTVCHTVLKKIPGCSSLVFHDLPLAFCWMVERDRKLVALNWSLCMDLAMDEKLIFPPNFRIWWSIISSIKKKINLFYITLFIIPWYIGIAKIPLKSNLQINKFQKIRLFSKLNEIKQNYNIIMLYK